MTKTKYIVYWFEDHRTTDFMTDDGLDYQTKVFDKYTDAIKKHTEIKKKYKEHIKRGEYIIKNIGMFKRVVFFDKKGTALGSKNIPYPKKDEAFSVIYGY